LKEHQKLFERTAFERKQDLLGQVSGTAVLDCYSNFGSNDSGSVFRVRIQGRDLGLGFRVGIQGWDSVSGFRVGIQGSGSGFRVWIQGQDLGSGIRVSI
jgi:hypothetical protein